MLNEDYKDILRALSAERAEFIIVGAFALAAHGLPRATGDIDIWVRPTPENAARVLRALASFGAPVGDLCPEDLSAPDIVFQIGVPPRRIDIITGIDGVAFEEAQSEKLELDLGEIRVPVLSRAHLIRNKEITARPKDLLDLELLRSRKTDPA